MGPTQAGNTLWIWAAAGVAAVVAVVFLAAVELPDTAEKSICFFRLTTGIPCPGCGLTRAFSASVKGDWQTAFFYHPAALFLAVQLAAGWLYWGLITLGICRGPRMRRLNQVLIGNGVVLLLTWVVRLVWYP